jgi:hypothetical protein
MTLAPRKEQQELIKDIEAGVVDPSRLTAEEIRSDILSDMVPVQRAIFAVEGCGLEVFVDEDTGAKYFTDEKAFITKQKAAARKLVKDLTPDFKSVELVEGDFSNYDYVKADKDTVAKKKALCFVVISHDGTVTIKKNLVKKGSAKASDAAENKERAAASAALDAMAEAIGAKLRKKPQDALRFWLLQCAFPYSSDYPQMDWDVDLAPDTVKRELKPMAKLMDGCRLKSDADPAAVWRAISGIGSADVLQAFADTVAGSIAVTEFNTDTWDFADALGVLLTPEQDAIWRKELAGDQVELEAAIAKKKAAE